jgi:hypothetical protein
MEQQSLVFLLATARLALRTRHFLAAPFAQENADFRRNTCRPPSVPEVSNWLAIVPRECACLKTVLPARSISHLVQFRVATASAVPEVEKSFDKATKAKQPRLGRNCRIVDVIDVISDSNSNTATELQRLNMASKAFLLAVAVAFCCSLKAQTSVPSVLFRGNCETGLPRFEDWYRQTRLPQGEPYVAAQDRKQQTTNNYLKVKLQMSLAEVEKLLGKPDFATGKPVPRPAASPGPTGRRCSAETAYVLSKNSENMTDLQDVAIYLFFSRDGKLLPRTYLTSSRLALRVEKLSSFRAKFCGRDIFSRTTGLPSHFLRNRTHILTQLYLTLRCIRFLCRVMPD